ncbi:hypothetical protein AWC38_SpisGene381 [Stylophora pistillata]|uniref:Uncharacterized protein n=1 Tax=Stylophora pistillata TaxID=50429 RepID=A0A2B4T1N8_STYPI|nr:hypothetical protein AWC38_SpisGene381 [Stylophora pistillata]
MLAGFKGVNDSHIVEDVVIGSADVKALYPSLDIPFTIEKVCEVFYTSGVRVDGLNKEELELYLAVNRSEAELEVAGLLQFCPRRKTSRGRPLTITGCALDEDRTKRFWPWLPPAEDPDEDAVRRMFTEAMKLFMVWWDRQFKIKMNEFGLRVRMYKRCDDDINVVVDAPGAGLRFIENEGRVIRGEDILEQELAIEADKRCMNLVQKIGNSIHPSISLEVDYSSQHADGKLPILDLKVWVESRRVQGVGEGENKRLQYSGYNQKFRTEVVRSALKAYNRMIELDASGEQPLYRPREWKRIERDQKRREKRESWYRKGGFDTVIFVPATPASELKNRYMEEVKGAGLKVKVVEQSGVTLKRIL